MLAHDAGLAVTLGDGGEFRSVQAFAQAAALADIGSDLFL
jgi:hypothetical protein